MLKSLTTTINDLICKQRGYGKGDERLSSNLILSRSIQLNSLCGFHHDYAFIQLLNCTKLDENPYNAQTLDSEMMKYCRVVCKTWYRKYIILTDFKNTTLVSYCTIFQIKYFQLLILKLTSPIFGL